MQKIDLEEQKSIQLEILAEVDKFCEKNNLIYYMSYGTLLGAVRHKGYIPWDDDIDITMPYHDYIFFCENFDSSVYRVHFWKKKTDYPCNFAKVDDKRTILKEEISSNYQIGINIDVSPLIGLPDDYGKAQKHFEKITFYRSLITLKKMKISRDRKLYKNLIVLMAKAVTYISGYVGLNRKIDDLSSQYDYDKSKYVISVGSFNGKNEIIEKSRLGNPIRLKFEQYFFSAPEGFDSYLSTVFGNYLELPPVEKRVSHHTFDAYRNEG